jgi:hypothetical protein
MEAVRQAGIPSETVSDTVDDRGGELDSALLGTAVADVDSIDATDGTR